MTVLTNKMYEIFDQEEFSFKKLKVNKTPEEIDTYNDEKGYIVCRIKKKKWKKIQLIFSSNKQFGLFLCTLEVFIGGYIKR